MSASRLIGAVLLVIGVILLYFGWESSQSVVDQVSDTLTGRFTRETMWYFIGGAAASVLGVLMLLFGRPR